MLLVFAVIGGVYYAYRIDRTSDITFYEKVLVDYRISTTVSLEKASAKITEGVLQHKEELSERDVFNTLRIAYAQALAERSPLLAIPETDTFALEGAAQSLDELAGRLSALQKDQSTKDAVRTALYPTRFLRSLSRLERARSTFLAGASDVTLKEYTALQQATIRDFSADLSDHEAAFKRIIPKDTAGYGVFNGVITRDTILMSMESLRRGIGDTAQKIRQRAHCIGGLTSYCDADLLAIPSVQVPEPTPSAARDSEAREIHSFYSELAKMRGKEISGLVQISQSTCFGTLNVPLLFTLQNRDDPLADIVNPELVGTMIFIPTAKYSKVPFYQYFAKNGIPYAYFPAFAFYKCPDIVVDSGRVFETVLIADVANDRQSNRPLVESPALEEALTARPDGILRESDALAYLDEMRTNFSSRTPPASQKSQKALNRLISLILAAQYGSARFEQFVQKVEKDEELNLALIARGVPTELGASYLFYVKSAFFSLFLGTNPSVAGVQRAPVDTSRSAKTESEFVSYQALRKIRSRADIKSYVKFYFDMHQREVPVSTNATQ